MNPLLQNVQHRRVDDALFIHHFGTGTSISVDMKSDFHPTQLARQRSTILSHRLNFATNQA
ncbi:MAG: hypothetical protein CVV08_24150 [Gammaproteobacteria bacterium HGW-Gammaproteobacteria-12]|nr:MAG: hypothetical protein CVV08_24150 [Gammaproteobacteria bacterium HGW-Gammaproteobacteria-12]